MKRPSPYQSILWDMDLKSTPALISAPVVRAAEQQVHAAVSPTYLNKIKKGNTRWCCLFFMEEVLTGLTVKKIAKISPLLRTTIFVSILTERPEGGEAIRMGSWKLKAIGEEGFSTIELSGLPASRPACLNLLSGPKHA